MRSDKDIKILTNIIDHHAPINTRIIVARPKVPWYNGEIDKVKRARRKAERIWRRTRSLSDLKTFKMKWNHVVFLMNQARSAFYAEFVHENGNDQGKLFKAAKTLLSEKDEPLFPNYQDKTNLVNDIGQFFVNKIDTIRSNIEACIVNSSSVPDDVVANNATTAVIVP